MRLSVGGRSVEITAPPDAEPEVRAALDAGEPDPGFWAHLWPATLAMARFVGRTPMLGPGMRVLELGCGLGVVGVACAARGCDVVMTDGDARGVEWARANARHNGLDAVAAAYDWGAAPDELWRLLDRVRSAGWRPDAIVGSDILYNPAWHGAIARIVREAGALAIIADPCRGVATPALDAFEREGLCAWDTLLDGGGQGPCRAFLAHPA